MNRLHQLQQLIEDAIANYEYPKQPVGLYEPISYFMQIGGKRIRPVLLLLAVELFGLEAEKHISEALAIEFFHNFTLIHDDIMDNAPLRRGKTTVHTQWNTNTAILSGDVMLIEAYQLLSKTTQNHFAPLIQIFNQTAKEVYEGQQYDMNFETLETVRIDEYLEMIRLKTAVLLGASLKMGALLANANTEQATFIYNFGVNLGIAFQLQDDYLDVFATNDQFGKQKAGDIIANKKTFLLLKAFENAKNEDLKTLHYYIYENPKVSNEEKIEKVTAVFQKLQIPEITQKMIESYAQKAMSALEAIAVPVAQKENLRSFVNLLNQRTT